MSHELVIRNGTVIDGTGLAGYRADIGVDAGRITAIGRIRERGHQDIDAEGHIVTPGFIDGHTHMDAQIFWDRQGSCSSWHGVTSVVMGNCGFTLAPASAKASALVMRNLERAEDISGAAMAAGIQWSWETFPQFLDAIDKLPKGINYAGYIGHSALRTWAMGERAFEGKATPEDEERMKGQLREAIHAGAIGLSTSRGPNHETSDNRPVASRLASWDELRRLVNCMGELGAGIFELSREEAYNSPDPAARKEFNDRMVALAVESGVPITFGIQPRENREVWEDNLKVLDDTARLGGRMLGQTHSKGTTVVTSFLTQLPFDRISEWKDLRAKPIEEQKRLLRDPAVRQYLINAANHGDYGRAIGAEPKKPNWNRYWVYEKPAGPITANPSLATLSAESGKDPVEIMIDVALKSDFKQFFIQSNATLDAELLLATMKHPHTVMTFSDSGAHVSQIIDCTIQSHLLTHWARDRQAFTIEDAVRMVTLAPARLWGLHDRGMLRVGMAADINVIDLPNLAPELPEVAYDLPGGARRLIQRSRGIRATVVNGQVLQDRGQYTGATPGQLLRGPLAQVN